MNTEINEVEINGIKYIRKDTIQSCNLTDSVLVRSESAGVFFGQIITTDLTIGFVNLKNARRIWYWAGAASLSQLAIDGTTKPKECKFPEAVAKIKIGKVIEIIPCTEKAAKSISEVSIWKQ